VSKKKLQMNVEKTKMMVFNKKKGKNEENEWNWNKYLGCTFNEGATEKTHIREIVRKVNKAVGCICGI
jgi:hypothetical protein